MTDRETSSPTARDLLRQAELEYDRAHRRFDATDTKAGLVLGFAATLLGLTFTVTGDDGTVRALLSLGRVAGASAAVAGLVAIWPRKYERLSLPKLRQHVQDTDPDDALLDLLDERIKNVGSVADVTDRKVNWVTGAMTALTAAALLVAAAALLT